MSDDDLIPVELPARRTTLTPLEVAEVFVPVYRDHLGGDPTIECVSVFCAHIMFETAWTNQCFDFQFGNMKHVEGDGQCWTFYACGEELDIHTAQALVEKDPTKHQILPEYSDQVRIVSVYAAGTRASVRFIPKHPYCAFVAHKTARLGMIRYVTRFTDGRYQVAMPFAIHGDAAGFSHAIRLKGYYTAPEGPYTDGLVKTAANYPRHLPVGWKPSDVVDHPVIEPVVTLISDEEKRWAMQLVSLNVAEASRALLSAPG